MAFPTRFGPSGSSDHKAPKNPGDIPQDEKAQEQREKEGEEERQRAQDATQKQRSPQ